MAGVVREAKYIKSNVDHNNNKFWYITEFNNATCRVHYGRVGAQGQTKTHTFATQTHATNFFDMKCHEKEGERKGYRKLQVLNGATGVEGAALPNDSLEKLATQQISADCAQTLALIRYLTKINVHNILSATTMKYDVDSGLFTTPCGIVTKDGIAEARRLLAEIGDYVGAGAFFNPQYKSILNDYLMLIPQKVGSKLDPATLYPDLEAVRKQNDILDSLEASLQAILSRPQGGEPTAVGKVFEVRLDRVEDRRVIDRIRKKYHQTIQSQHACAHLEVKTVYAVQIDAMQRAWEESGRAVGNVMELWHGTRAANLLSILKSGFVIPPSNAPHCSGRMFGNGCYFSDQSTKSLNYAYGYWGGGPQDNNCFMFLVDVAMGRYYVPSDSSERLPKPGYDSTFARAGHCGVMNNEMIVYQTCQINPQFLVEFAPV